MNTPENYLYTKATKSNRKHGKSSPCQSRPSAPKDETVRPTIDLENPHRSLLGKAVEAFGNPKKLDLDSLKHVDALDATTRANAEFLLECLDESAELNNLGHLMVDGLVREFIQTHHRIRNLTQRDTFSPIRNPVFILGLPRTGSSYLFNLLGATQRFRTLRHWETHHVGSRKPELLKKLDAAIMLKGMHHLTPGFRTVHEIRLEGPEECTKPLMGCFVSQSFPGIFHIPGYNKFLDTADYLPSYEFYYKQLQILGSQRKRWLLKSPIHMQSIDSLLKVFPDAKFIHLHRDFEEAACSICSLTAAYRCLTCRRINGSEIGREVSKYLGRDLAKAKPILEANREKVLDIHFRKIVDHPVQTVKEIFDFVGDKYSSDVEQALRREMQVSIPDKYGKHVYRYEDYYPSGSDIPQVDGDSVINSNDRSVA